MTKQRWLLAFAAIAIASAGCSKAMPVVQAEDPTLTAAQLGLAVLKSGEDSEVPSREEDASAVPGTDDSQRVYQGEDLMFSNTIFLPVAGQSRGSTNPIYFVWDQAGEGYTIESAFYSMRMHDDLNQIGGEPKVLPASFDLKNHRWYVPFSDLFGGHEGEIDPSTLYTLRLDLLIEGRDPVHINVHFRVLGPLPKVDWTPLPQDSISSPFSFSEASAKTGYVVGKEQVTNPSAHRLLLWASPGETSLKLTSIVTLRLGFGKMAHRYSSVADFSLNELWIHRSSVAEKVTIGEGQWKQIPLDPGETVILEWVAYPVPGTPTCTVPDPVLGFVPITYELTDSGMSGTWNRALDLTDPVSGLASDREMAPELAPLSSIPRIARLSPNSSAVLDLTGPNGVDHADRPWKCQGVF